MGPRIAVALLTVIALILVAGIQLADPELEERNPPVVDFSEPPSDVASDAARQFEYIDYAYRIDIADNRSGEWQQVGITRVQNTEQRYRSVGPIGEKGSTIFGNNAVAYVRYHSNSSWRLVQYRDMVYPAEGFTQPVILHRLQTPPSSKHENQSELLIQYNDSVFKIIDEYNGTSKLYVNKETGLIERAEVRYEIGDDQYRYLRFKVTEIDVNVERPKGVQDSTHEFTWDLLRGPVFHI